MGSKSALVLTGGMIALAVVLALRQNPSHGGLAVGDNLREVNSPSYVPVGGGPVIRGYIDESPWNPNENGGEPVIPGHYGVQRQQSSGLL